MRARPLALLLPLLCSTALAAPVQPLRRGQPLDQLTRFSWLHELSGACWAGTDDDGKPVDTRCWTAQFDQFLRETTREKVPRGEKVVDLEIDSVIAWDRDTGNLEVFAWASDGSWRRAEGTLWKQAYRFQDRTADGSPPMKRTIWRRLGNDAYTVTYERREGDRWVDYRRVTYERVKG